MAFIGQLMALLANIGVLGVLGALRMPRALQVFRVFRVLFDARHFGGPGSVHPPDMSSVEEYAF